LLADDTPVMVINPEDSVRIQVTVQNSGNTVEEVTVVFNVPNLRGASPFTELKETLAPREQKRFTYSFIPSNNLLSAGQFSVRITAMKGKEKMIFGNKTVTCSMFLRTKDMLISIVSVPCSRDRDRTITLLHSVTGSTTLRQI